MAGLALDGEPRGQEALLADADHRDRARVARHDAVDHEEPLVEHELERDAAPRKVLGDALRALAAADLLVVPEAEVDRAARREALREERLDRLEVAEHGLLVVDAPRPTQSRRARRRRTGRRSTGRVGRHDVEVRVRHVRLGAAVGALPLVHEAVRVDDGALQVAVDGREARSSSADSLSNSP